MKIAVAGTGYVGLSVALLLSQHNEVHALDIVPEKVELLNNGKSPIVDSKITAFLDADRSGERPLDFQATLDPEQDVAGSNPASPTRNPGISTIPGFFFLSASTRFIRFYPMTAEPTPPRPVPPPWHGPQHRPPHPASPATTAHTCQA